jgi:hypothetical protein
MGIQIYQGSFMCALLCQVAFKNQKKVQYPKFIYSSSLVRLSQIQVSQGPEEMQTT